MPPRTRRPETPARREARIAKHLGQARDYWSKWPAHLAKGDYCQAGEKGWDTVAQLTKAVAALRSWDHYDHEAIRDAITGLMAELPEQALTIDRGLRAAEGLHGNFYEVYMNALDTPWKTCGRCWISCGDCCPSSTPAACRSTSGRSMADLSPVPSLSSRGA